MELTDTPWALYFPIDGDMEGERLPPSWIDLLREVDVPIAMSRYGQRIVAQCGISSQYIPHGVDLDIFCPPPDRETAKALIGASGKFVILSDSRNQPRKMLPRLLDIFAKFSADHPDAILHLHTDPEDEFTQSGVYSYNIRADLRYLGIESRVHFTPGWAMKRGGGLPLNKLAVYYQAADVHLLASSGEGFGLPTLQAAAAGAVPMAGAYTASRELVEGHGETIKIAAWTENEFAIRRGLIDVDDAVAKLARFYDDRELLCERSAQSRKFALQYGWDSIVDQWDLILRSLAQSRRRITRVPVQKVESFQKLLPQLLPKALGASVSVKFVERQLGRAEVSIRADAQQVSDVRIPVVPKPCEVERVRVPRSPGFVCIAPTDVSLFLELKRIFPILSGWVPLWSRPEMGSTPENLEVEDLEYRYLECIEEGRFDLAQSILLLNVGGGMASELLIDAALFGVPCVGTGQNEAQLCLWPDLVTEHQHHGLQMARALLTDAALMQRVSTMARLACQSRYSPDEEDSAFWLRQLHAKQKTAAALAAVR
jgi:glycosyltransferase involved in cell wall biosynthesis